MGNMHAACYGLIPDDCVPNASVACYSYWYQMIVVDAYSMLRWLVHDYYTRNALLQVMGLVHRNEFIVSAWNYEVFSQ